MERKEKKTRYGIALIVFAVLFSCFAAWLVGRPLIRWLGEPDQFRDWVSDKGALGVLAFIGLMLVQVVIALIPGEPFEIAAGYAFGALEGTVLCVAASAIGSMLVFGLVRRFGIRLVEIFFSKEKLRSLRFLRASPKRDYLYLLVFMIPGTPKDLLCYFAGLTDIRFPVWLIICSLGRVPSIITSTIGGSALSTKNYWFAVGVFAVTLALSGLGLLAYNALRRRHGEKNEKETA